MTDEEPALDERGATPLRIQWSSDRAGDWATSIHDGDRATARALYEEFGEVLEQEVAEEGGNPVLSHPKVNELIRAHLRGLPGTRALDAGCGPTPVAAIALADAGFHAVGVDIAQSIVRLAKRTTEAPVVFAVTDGESLPFPDRSFDVVTCDDVIEHVFDQPALVGELARVTRPGGRLLLVTPNASGFHVLLARARDLAHGRRRPRAAYHITQSHVRELRWRELHDLVRPWFRVVEALPMTFPDHGRWHHLNTLITRAPTGARLGPIHFFVLERSAAPAGGTNAGHAGHYAARHDRESQTSPDVVRAAFDAARSDLPLSGLVLDLGCGGGANLQALARDGISAIGVDVSLSALEGGQDAAPRVVADAARLPFRPDAFGSAVCTEVLEHVDAPSAVLAEASRVLGPEGRVYITVPNYANLAGVHKLWADRRSGRHDWNPWGAHEGGYEAFMTGRRLWAAARPHFDLERVRALDYGQALTGRFPVLDRLAVTAPAQRVLRKALPRLHRPGRRVVGWHGMHTELVLRRRRVAS